MAEVPRNMVSPARINPAQVPSEILSYGSGSQRDLFHKSLLEGGHHFGKF